jgi:hypothetical protein
MELFAHLYLLFGCLFVSCLHIIYLYDSHYSHARSSSCIYSTGADQGNLHGSFPCSPPCASPIGYEPCAPTLAYQSPIFIQPSICASSLSSLLTLLTLSSLSSSFSICIMSRSEDLWLGYAHIPILTKDNFSKWPCVCYQAQEAD